MIGHNLIQIAMDGSQKLPVRILEPLRLALCQEHDTRAFVMVLAAWLGFLRQCFETKTTLQDPLHETLWSYCLKAQAYGWDSAFMVRECPIFDQTLTQNPLFSQALTAALEPLMATLHQNLYEDNL